MKIDLDEKIIKDLNRQLSDKKITSDAIQIMYKENGKQIMNHFKMSVDALFKCLKLIKNEVDDGKRRGSQGILEELKRCFKTYLQKTKVYLRAVLFVPFCYRLVEKEIMEFKKILDNTENT